ncbi:RimJ/RimL family protein N-acetyltransferase [Kribbella voronezhensis]|uniref:RimJ/RimL family protein N-acetyltransferase n=1 Tax=Kribbella voronezhensis TaxID=2512212 RepID=A0A4R7T6Y6_9ACTN|nr:GNAT family N-acetyltransferase [Kribbella voronezhensis]TDU87670.1 RimJ/RimL family protein N-acetyltransferase [Kribbella voronezhensis]
MILETPRLRLVPLGPEHARELWNVYSDPEVARYVGGDSLTPDSTREQTERWAQTWTDRGYGQSAVILRETGAFLGRIGLSVWPDWNETELGYALSRSSQGKGLAQEGCVAWIDWAGSNLPDDHLIAVINPLNLPSLRLAHRLGFTLSRHETVNDIEVGVHRLDLSR